MIFGPWSIGTGGVALGETPITCTEGHIAHLSRTEQKNVPTQLQSDVLMHS